MTRFTGIHFGPHSIRMKVDGHPTMNRIVIAPRVPMVGHYKRSEPVVMIDRKITDPKERQSIALHEAGERYLRFHSGLGPVQAHRIAQREETHWDHQHGVNVPRLTRNVERVFRQNARDGVRRRR